MLYITNENWGKVASLNAGNKAREDITAILYEMGAREFVSPAETGERSSRGILGKLAVHFDLYKQWKIRLSKLNSCDLVVIQYPLPSQTIFLYRALRFANKKGVKVVLLLHDLDTLRWIADRSPSSLSKRRLLFEQKHSVQEASFLISHNERMTEVLVNSLGCSRNSIVELGLFDYCSTGESTSCVFDQWGPIVIAGNLAPHKAAYIYELPSSLSFKLYGIGLDANKIMGSSNTEYVGKFQPNDGPNVIRGSWGLVWDGDSSDTCSGAYGEYLRINNPHKTSLYLAAGIPVIIWNQAALAQFIEENELGITINSLSEIKDRLDEMSPDKYKTIVKNVSKISKKLRAGYFTKRAITRLLDDCSLSETRGDGVEGR